MVPSGLRSTQRTRRPSRRPSSAGAATRLALVQARNDLDVARAANADLHRACARTRLSSRTNTCAPCTASAGTSSALAFSRVTTLASTLMPIWSGVSSGSEMRMR